MKRTVALSSQGIPTQHCRNRLRELYNNFTNAISPFYMEVIVKIGAWQGDTISPKLAALKNIMRHSEWENFRVKVDDRYLQDLRIADDIMLITINIDQAERMIAECDNACGKVGLRVNLIETISWETDWYVMLPLRPMDRIHLNALSTRTGREVNMMDDLVTQLSRGERVAQRAFKDIEGKVKKTYNIRLRVHLSTLRSFPL
ncbi:hypothetical protein V3C99_008282 [Haemonchus contortus]